MTATHDPDQGIAVFRAWFPQVAVVDDKIRCTFDVTTSGEVFLNEGTPELCHHIAGRLGIQVDAITTWTIQRFCTPFYTHFPDSEDWVERYPLAWRMSIDLRGTLCPRRRPSLDPVPVSASDPTWRWIPSFWVPGLEECEVLAIEVTEPGTGTLESFAARLHERFPDQQVVTSEITEPRRVARVGRVQVGRLAVAETFDRLDTIKDACTEMGLATTIPRFELLRARVG